MIQGKHVIVLMASVTTGITIRKSMECISYYGGMLVGISAIFSAVDEVEGQPVNAVFHKDDIPDYQSCAMHDCPLCKEGRRIDALVNSFWILQAVIKPKKSGFTPLIFDLRFPPAFVRSGAHEPFQIPAPRRISFATGV